MRRRRYSWWLQWLSPLPSVGLAIGQAAAGRTALAVLFAILAIALTVGLASTRPTTDRTDSQERSD